MANRMLRDWTGSESIDNLSEGAEVFFTRLIMKADDFGCYYGNPKILSSTLYPLRNISHDRIIKLRDECAQSGVIQVYKVEGKDYVCIRNFGQRLRAMNRKFPEPPEMEVQSEVSAPPSDDSHMTAEEKGREVETEEEVEVEEKEVADALLSLGGFAKVWNEWEQHRKEKRAPLTPSVKKKQLKFLARWPPEEAIAIIEQSLLQGWTGLFELKNKSHEHRIKPTGTLQPTTAIIEPDKSFGVEKGFSRSGSN